MEVIVNKRKASDIIPSSEPATKKVFVDDESEIDFASEQYSESVFDLNIVEDELTCEDTVANMKDGMTCAICLELYFRPCSLVCGHTFCKGCISKHIKTAEHQKKECSCPTCRDSIVISCGQLRENIALKSLICDYFPTKVQEAELSLFEQAKQTHTDIIDSRNRLILYKSQTEELKKHYDDLYDMLENKRKQHRQATKNCEIEYKRALALKHDLESNPVYPTFLQSLGDSK